MASRRFGRIALHGRRRPACSGRRVFRKEFRMTDVRSRTRAVIALAAGFAAATAWPARAEVPITAVPPAEYKGGATIDKSATTKMLSRGAPAVTVTLPAPTAAERDVLKARNASGTTRLGTKA